MTSEKRVERLAWIFFMILAIPYIMVYFHRVAPAIVADLLMSDFKLSGAVLGNLAAIYFYVYTLMQLPAGLFADSFGARRTVFWGMLVAGIGSILFGSAPFLGLAYTGRAFVGLGVSVIFVSILKIVAEWFPNRKFGTMSGLTLMIGNSGAILAATPLSYIVTIWGWRLSFVTVGIFCLLAGILVLLFVRDRPAVMGLPSPNSGTVSPLPTVTHALRGLLGVTKNPYSWPPFIVFFGIYGSLMAFQGVWGMPFLVQNYHMSRIDASSTLLVMALGLVVGCPTAGAISDRIKRRKLPLGIFTMLYIGCWLAMLVWPGGKPPSNVLPILFFVMGFFASGFIIVWACAKEVNSPKMAGSAMGLANMGGFLGAAIMQPLLGLALDMKWTGLLENGVRIYALDSYRFAFAISTVLLVLTAGAIFFIKETNAKIIANSSSKPLSR